jgi:hypothetical protein
VVKLAQNLQEDSMSDFNVLTLADLNDLSMCEPDEISSVDFSDIIRMARIGAAYLEAAREGRDNGDFEDDEGIFDWLSYKIDELA